MYLVVQNLAVMIIILHWAEGQVISESEAYSSLSLQEVVPAFATGSHVKEENIIERTILVSHSSSSSLEEQNNLDASRRRRLLEEEQDHEEVDDDDEEDNDQEDSKRAKPDAIRPQHQEIQEAGAEKAKSQFNKFIDRFSTERMKQLQQQQKHHLKQQNDDAIKKNNHHHHDVMTDKMKIHTPGTPEFQARQQSLMDHINQHHHQKNKNNKNMMRQKVPSTNTTVNDLRKGELPFHKDVSNDKDHHNILRKSVAKIPGFHKLIQPKKLSLEEELILDASMTFYTHLETSIYKTQDGKLMTEDEIVALSDWLDLVSIALPPEWHLHKLIDALRDRFEYIAEGMDHMREILQQHRLRKKMWSPECTTDRRGGRLFHVGFDCGMWKLLHIITLGVAEQRGGLNLIESGMMSPSNTKTFSPLEAANAIRNMLQFYYNDVYDEEFVRQYDDCKNHRRCDRLTDDKEGATIGDWKELALWLWEVHNEITIQVVLKETKAKAASKNRIGAVPSSSFGAAAAISSIELTDEEQMHVMWPSIEDCYQCFEEDGTWDENEVFYHLEAHYW
eukprot:scaffold4225_cov128-Cylindrotheca_fusiformis.AAC.3